MLIGSIQSKYYRLLKPRGVSVTTQEGLMSSNFYRLRSEAREGYIFTGISLFNFGGGWHQMHHGIGHMVTPLVSPPPWSDPVTPSPPGHTTTSSPVRPGHTPLVRPGHHHPLVTPLPPVRPGHTIPPPPGQTWSHTPLWSDMVTTAPPPSLRTWSHTNPPPPHPTPPREAENKAIRLSVKFCKCNNCNNCNSWSTMIHTPDLHHLMEVLSVSCTLLKATNHQCYHWAVIIVTLHGISLH